jgi:L,D-transpeptidase YcbB
MRLLAASRGMVAALAIAASLVAAPELRAQALTGFMQSVAEAAAGDADIAGFYRGRNYAPLWTAEGAGPLRAAFLHALDQADAHGLPTERYRPEAFAEAFRAARGEREIGALEVKATQMFLAYAQDLQSGALEPTRILPAEIKRVLPRRDRVALIEGFANAANPANYLRDLAPKSAAYARLLREKARLERLVEGGGWGAEVPAATLEPGQRGAAVVALRDRLIAMGYMPRSSAATYDGALQAAVRAFQDAHGIEPDGIVGRATLAEINRGPAARLRSVLVALERERWMNYEDGLGSRHVWVNLPDFHARIVDDGKVTFETRAVVGERIPEKRTYEFSDRMQYLEVNPDWTVPPSILARDYLPRMQRNPNAASYLQLIDRRGRVVPRSAINFSAYTARNFPFTVRQPPGGDNALGKVKFMFPNPYAIYLHDTPAKHLFSREQRDYSSGCIRLNDPFGFAYELLSRQVDDPRDHFDRLVASGRQSRVNIERHVPVHLVYFTAFSEADGRMQYRRDIYERDARLFDALLKAGVAFPGAEG